MMPLALFALLAAPLTSSPADAPTASAPAPATSATASPAAADEKTASPTEAATAVPATGDASPAADAAAPGAPPKIVAILDLKVDGDTAALANALGTVMASDISNRPGYKAASRNELKALLAHTADANLLGCQSANCAVDIAKLVDANLVVAGNLGQVTGGDAGPGGKALLLTLSLIDPTGPAVVQRVDITWRGDPAELVTVIPPALDKLFDGPKAANYTGEAEIFAPEGITVAIDGKELTKEQHGKVGNLPIGVHVVVATGTGYVPARKDIVISHGETTVTRLILDEEPYYTQWWFWTAVGSGAAVAVAGGTAIALASLQQPPAPPTRIVVKTPLPSTTAAAE